MGDNVFVNNRAAVHAKSAGKSVAFPDVCLCPPAPPAGPVPTPLPNTVVAPDLTNGATTVHIEDSPAGHAQSFFAKSTGNEISRPTGGGVVTHAVQGTAHFRSFSHNVFFEGQPAVRHMDLLTHNHLAPALGNTPPAVWMSTMSMPAVAPPSATKAVSKDKRNEAGWARVRLRDTSGAPVTFVRYVVDAGGERATGRALRDGCIDLQRMPKGTFELTLPDLDVGGWKHAQPGPAATRGETIRVRQGDTMARVAWRAGFTTWQSIYGAPENAALREARPNPEILLPGDEIFVPAKRPPVFTLASDKEHELVVSRGTFLLRLAPEDDGGQPLAAARFEIIADEHPDRLPIKGSLDGDGVLQAEIPLDVWLVTLRVWPSGSDDDPPFAWTLFVGGLDPVEEVTGIQARLESLGHSCGGERGELGPATRDAWEQFKTRHGISEDDPMGPQTKAALVREYGC